MSLVVESPNLDPDVVTERLAIEPTSKRMPGPSKWRSPEDVNGLWLLECDERTSRKLDEQVERILSAITAKGAELRALQADGCEVYLDVFGFVGNGATFQLPAEVVARMAEIGIPLRVAASTSER
ncbi:DUF4279 domain-containing protein [Streptomyces sp. P1-3]|uniref:DUF4279 domain-containing protein n=1 Tax=Streptomyces sp. P1-3 TaxID=3421658 RepID=UPI003D36D36B